MDSGSLKTASAYLNNLLLARGLLRNGVPIEFAHPSRGDGGREATMAGIINLVHDLILRRDREQEKQEGLAQTLRSLRADASRNTLALERSRARNDELSRQLSLAQSQERSVRAALRSAESSARALRDEMARLKTTVNQVRASCANDIRKRDIQIQRLKSHLTAQQRGNRAGLVGASITITPSASVAITSASTRDGDGIDVEDSEYSLKQETTEFLTQLSQSLSDENDNLIGLIRRSLATLKELQGLPESVFGPGDSAEDQESNHAAPNAEMLHVLPSSYDSLAVDMDGVLEILRLLLTNPSFVPLEEVEVREEEINRLRDACERMQARWKEALMLMEGWRRRLLEGGDTVNLDELKIGLGQCPKNRTVLLITFQQKTDENASEIDPEDSQMQPRSSTQKRPASRPQESRIPREVCYPYSLQFVALHQLRHESVIPRQTPILTSGRPSLQCKKN
ncbi:Afadin and alpha-actinin-binding-domain-containing protein [Lineolata rhizophorae]|uniref:Afadin and alpha-actinin-binding-domain-containing protein n=1 Tax=Lineolata rhizophorae TaxID=578093 RepID=A0A6A6NZ44_9PEZI|nr:Afadin and alpha-actinin-binding-domain-containing protein [Lineolata rhizophorae]